MTAHRPRHTPHCSQGVDLFQKSFIFVPIHEALHWSVAIVCDPGLHVDNPEPIILHLDSMEGERRRRLSAMVHSCCPLLFASIPDARAPTPGAHNPGKIFSELRSYLQHEWVRLATDADGETRPKAWETTHGGERPNFLASANKNARRKVLSFSPMSATPPPPFSL